MNHQRLLFEYSPALIILCIGVGVGYAWLLYRAKYPWSVAINRTLFCMRAVLVTFLAFLLIGPILKLTHSITEKPALVFLIDDSESLKETTDSLKLRKLVSEVSSVSNTVASEGFEVNVRNLSEKNDARFVNPTSDLTGAIRTVIADYEGRNLAGIVLLSDGIYNSGPSPLYTSIHVPVYTVGVGDTTQRTDLALKNLAYNKIAYQGNQFPLRAEVSVLGFTANEMVTVSVFQGGRKITQMQKNTSGKLLVDFDFKLDAVEKGLQRIDVVVDPVARESNIRNNRASAFVEVVAGKKKILLIAPAPHPDIKALRSVVEKNSNYEFALHIPGVKEADPAILQPGKADLVIFHQVSDQHGKIESLFNRFNKAKSSFLAVVGSGSNLRQLIPLGIPLKFENVGQSDEVTPIINPTYRDFSFSTNINNVLSKYPPLTVPFGKFSYPPNASVLLYQRIGNVDTDRPLVLTYDDSGRKAGLIIGDGIWRWRLNEFNETQKSEGFDEVFSKLIQYLSTQEDRRKFRSFPVQNQFTDSEPVIFESQVYNDLFEQVYGNRIDLELRDDKGKKVLYNYVTSPGSTRYRIGGLKEGVYKYTASTELGGKSEQVRGEFLVLAQNLESQNLTADFALLRKLSANTGGKFYPVAAWSQLGQDVAINKAKGLIHSEEAFNPLINLKWVFFILLSIVTGEWFLRKYLGAY